MPAERLLLMMPLFAMLAWAAVVDLRQRRIPNWLTLSIIASGLAQSIVHPALSPAQSALGLLCGFALTFVLFAMGALGGGDVKLLAGVGAWMGPAGVFVIFVAAAIVGMVMVIVQSIAQGRLRVLLRNSAVVAISVRHMDALGLEHTVQTGTSCRSVDRPLPYAVPVLIGMAAWIVAGRISWQM